MTGPTLVLLSPHPLSDSARSQIRHALEDWEALGRSRPLVLDDGMHLGVIGGMAVAIELAEGPLDGIRIGLTLTTLSDLPGELQWEAGSYQRWAEDGVQRRTTDGAPVYRWAPE